MESTPFDAIKFIVNIKNKTRIAPKNIYRGKKRLSYFDCTDVGPWAYCFKRKFLVDNNIRFNENIGPGTGVIKSGEDVLFIRNFFKKGGKMGSSPLVIGDVLQEESTWYEGFNDSFLINEGGIYYLLYKPFHFAFYIRHIILHKNDYNTGLFRALKLMIEGKRAAKAFLKNG